MSHDYGDTTIVLPTYNEAGSLPELLPELLQRMPGVHVIVSDDGSTDGTQDVVRSLGRSDPRVRLLDRSGRDRGLTAAVADALLEVDTEYAVVMDADGQHPPSAAPDIVAALRGGAPVAVGTRGNLEGLSVPRKAVSAAASTMTRAYLWSTGRPGTRDVMSGLFGVRAPMAADIVRRQGHEFERGGYKVLLDLLKRSPAETRVAEVPYQFRSRVAGESKIGITHVRALLRQLGPLGRAGAALCSARALRFGAVGASGILVNLAVFAALLELDAFPLAAASAVAVEVAILWNFALNRQWTWADRRGGLWSGLARFHAVSLVAMALNVVVLLLLVGAGAAPVPAQFVGIVLAAGVNFGGNHAWTFAPAGRAASGRARWYLAALALHGALAVGFADPEALFKATASVDAVMGGTSATALGPVPLALLTPLLAPLAATGAGPMMVRLATKLPVLAAVVIAAIAARDLARSSERGHVADLVERLVLFNPLTLIVVAMGAFEALALAATVGALALAARGRHRLAGAALGLGVLTGPTVLAALPAVAVWARARDGAAAARRCLAGAGVVVVAGLAAWLAFVPLDVLVDAGVGLASKAPGGFSLTRIVEYPAWFGWLGVWVPAVPVGVVVVASFTAVGLVVLGSATLAGRGTDARHAAFALAALFTGLVATLPVVSPPDLLLPLTMVAMLGVLPVGEDPLPPRLARRVFAAGTALVAGAAVLNGGRGVLLVPHDVALALFGTSTDTLLAHVGALAGMTRPVTGLVVGATAAVLYGSFLLWLARLVAPAIVDAQPLPTPRVRTPLRASGRRALTAAVGLALLLPPATAANMLLDAAGADGAPTLPDGAAGDPDLALLVRTQWTNPAADPDVRYGPWLEARTQPAAGYYETGPESLARAMWGAHEIGAGTLAIEAAPWNYGAFQTAAVMADSAGFRVLPVVDVAAIADDPALGSTETPARTDAAAARAIDGTVLRVHATLAGLPNAAGDDEHTVLLLGADALERGPIDPQTFWAERSAQAGMLGLDLVTIGAAQAGDGADVVLVPLVLDAYTGAVLTQRTIARLDAAPDDALVVVDAWNDHATGRALEPTEQWGSAALDALAAWYDAASAS